MLLSTVNPAAAAAIGTIKKVGVGNMVVYRGRPGYVRQGRAEFPAAVMRQWDDGSLDLLVFMEPEDMILESRVQFRSHDQMHHCWSAVTDAPIDAQAEVNKFANEGISRPVSVSDLEAFLEPILARLDALEAPMMVADGLDDTLAQPGAVTWAQQGETIADLTARIIALENKPKPGRPPNKPKAE